MKKFLGIVVLGLLLSGNAYAESIETRLDALEKRLDKLEKSLESLEFLTPLLAKIAENRNNSDQLKKDNEKAYDCVKITDAMGSIIDDQRNNEYYPVVELSWKITYENSCDVFVVGDPVFKILDKDGLILEEDTSYSFTINPNGTSIAKGRLFVQGKKKIDRMHDQSAGLKNLRVIKE